MKTYTVRRSPRTFTWPLVQPKVPWYRRLLKRKPYWPLRPNG